MLGLVDGETNIGGTGSLIRLAHNVPCQGEIMHSLAETICLAVDADLFQLYLVESEGEITKHSPGLERRPVYQIGLGSTVAAYTAYTRQMTRVTVPSEDERYPGGVGGMKDLEGKVLCHPICSSDGELEAIMELVRTSGNMFTEADCEVSGQQETEFSHVIASDCQQLHHMGRTRRVFKTENKHF